MKRKKIDMRDVAAIESRCDRCAMVGVSNGTGSAVKRGPKRLSRVRTIGASANMAEINNLDLEAGRFYTATEERHSALVTVIGSDVRDELFGKLDPVGRTIWVANQPMKVIGLLRKQGSVLGQSQDNQLYLPFSTWRKRFGARQSIDIFVRARGGIAGMEASMDQVRTILRGRRHTAFRDDDPFSVVTAEALQMVWKSISAGLFSLMIFISGISLVVGGIVIMNIMLVSVVERTREIGVRRAIGATRGNIQRQFLTEAVLLSLGGGIIGVLLGTAIAKSISAFGPLPTLVRPSLVLAGLMIAVVTGVIAGFVPALRASKLPPVEALRYE